MKRFFKISCVALVMIVLILLYIALQPEPALIPLVLSRETTYFTEPLDQNGDLDLEFAVNDYLRGKTTPETNANVLLWQAMGPTPEGGRGMHPAYWEWLGISAPPPDTGVEQYAVNFQKFVPAGGRPARGNDEIEADYERLDRLQHTPWLGLDHPDILEWLEANEKTISLTVQASQKPNYFNPLVCRDWLTNQRSSLIGCLLPNVQVQRLLGQLLSLRAMRRLGEGETAKAWQDLIALHRLSRLTSRGGCLIERLVSTVLEKMAMRGEEAFLNRAELSPTEWKRCLADLQSLPAPFPISKDQRVFEQVMFIDAALRIRNGSLFQPPPPSLLGSFNLVGRQKRRLVKQIDWNEVLRYGNGWFNQVDQVANLPRGAARIEAMNKLQEKRDAEMPNVDIFSARMMLDGLFQKNPETANDTLTIRAAKNLGGELFGAVFKVQNVIERVSQLQEVLEIAFALMAYQAEQKAYPPRLEELVSAGLLRTIANDRYTDSALIYRPVPRGFSVYSVGQNRIDEEGLVTFPPLNVKPSTRLDDIGILVSR